MASLNKEKQRKPSRRRSTQRTGPHASAGLRAPVEPPRPHMARGSARDDEALAFERRDEIRALHRDARTADAPPRRLPRREVVRSGSHDTRKVPGSARATPDSQRANGRTGPTHDARGRARPPAAARCVRGAADGQLCTIVSRSPWASSSTRTTCLGTPEATRVVRSLGARSSLRRTV
jgi:hypothetical protein